MNDKMISVAILNRYKIGATVKSNFLGAKICYYARLLEAEMWCGGVAVFLFAIYNITSLQAAYIHSQRR